MQLINLSSISFSVYSLDDLRSKLSQYLASYLKNKKPENKCLSYPSNLILAY